MITSFAPYGIRGASSRVRLYDWFDYLGWDVERHDYLGLPNNSVRSLAGRATEVFRAERSLRRQSTASDITIISREASPLSNGQLEARLLRGAGRGVFDFDDAIYLGGGRLRNLTNQETKARRATEAADVVIVGNEVLADWATAHSDNVEIIPSCVNPDDYETKTNYDIESAPTLVWVGSPSTERYLADIGDALAEVNRQCKATVIAISGSVGVPSALDQWPDVIRRVEWRPDLVASTLATADIALAPLRSDPYSQGKCAYKLLQYGAAGIPMVGSPVGANDLALTRLDGIKAANNSDWTDAIVGLLDESATARADRGGAAHSGVKQHYSFKAWGSQWQRAILGQSR